MSRYLLILLASACASDPVSQLEAPEATNDQLVEDMESSTVSGLVAVSGSARDWTLAFDDEGVIATVGIHAPGASDLSHLDGKDVSVELGGSWNSDTRTVAVSESGEPVFLVQPHESGPASDRFGSGFARFGEEVGGGSLSTDWGEYKVAYQTVIFETDDGEVEVLPGEPIEVLLDGDRWRMVVHGAFIVKNGPNAEPCGSGYSDTLSFEMLRVVDDVDFEPLEPVGGVALGLSSCG